MITIADCLKKAHASISDMDNRTVVLTEYNRRCIWRFKYYAINKYHAGTVLEDILVTQRKIDERQMTFDL